MSLRYAGLPLGGEPGLRLSALTGGRPAPPPSAKSHPNRRRTAPTLPQGRRGSEQIQVPLGHSSIQTPEKYLETGQNLTAIKDGVGFEMYLCDVTLSRVGTLIQMEAFSWVFFPKQQRVFTLDSFTNCLHGGDTTCKSDCLIPYK